MPSTQPRRPTVRASASLLAGSPRRVTGHVEIENRGAEALLVRAVEVTGAGTVPVVSTVAPGDSARVRVRLRLDPRTPPGRREVGGAAATYLPLGDPSAWGRAISAVAAASADERAAAGEAGRLRASGFSWERTARATLDAYREAAS